MNELVINFVSWVTLFHLLFSFVITMFQWRSLVAWNLSLVGLVEFTVFPEYLKQGTVVFESNFMNESCSCLFNFMTEFRVICINKGHYLRFDCPIFVDDLKNEIVMFIYSCECDFTLSEKTPAVIQIGMFSRSGSEVSMTAVIISLVYPSLLLKWPPS